MDVFNFYWYYLESLFYGFPFIIRVTVVLVTALLLMYLFFLIRIFYIAYRQKKKVKRKEKIRIKYEDKIKDIIYQKNNLSVSQTRNILGINHNKLKRWEKEYITHILLDIIEEGYEVKYT